MYVNGGSDGEVVVFGVGMCLHVGLVNPHDVHDEVLHAGNEFAVVGVPLSEDSVKKGDVRVMLLDA